MDLDKITSHSLFLVLLGLPPILALSLIWRNWRQGMFWIASLSALPALAAALLVQPGAMVELPWVLLGVRLGIDDTSKVFLFSSALLWLLSGIYGRSYLASDAGRPRFLFFFLLAMTGNFGLILAQDLASFASFFALMSFSSYGLIVYYADPEAVRAGRIYIYLVVLGEILLFAALVMTANTAGSLDIRQSAAGVANAPERNLIIALFLTGFGIKAGAIPLHVWLPLAHPVAPTPASAVLSGSVIKAGLLGWLRFLPLGLVALPGWGVFCIAIGLGAAFYGVLVGLTQSNPKTVLAYSSISQMGLIIVGIGIGLAAPPTWPLALSAILYYALHHALAKGSLFLAVGVTSNAIRGVGKRLAVEAGLLLPALALSGAPITSGAVAKSALKSATDMAPSIIWPPWLNFLLSLTALGTALLMARFVILIWPSRYGNSSPLGSGLWLPWGGLLAALALTTWLGPEGVQVPGATLSPAKLWSAVWPGGLGALLAWGAWHFPKNKRIISDIRIPSGDLLILASLLRQPFLRSRVNGARSALSNRMEYLVACWLTFGSNLINNVSLSTLERPFGRWAIVGILFLLIIVMLFVTLSTS